VLKAKVECCISGKSEVCEVASDGSAILPVGWVELRARRVVPNPHYAGVVAIRARMLEALTEQARMLAPDANEDELRSLVERQVGPASAPEYFEQEVTEHVSPEHASVLNPFSFDWVEVDGEGEDADA